MDSAWTNGSSWSCIMAHAHKNEDRAVVIEAELPESNYSYINNVKVKKYEIPRWHIILTWSLQIVYKFFMHGHK